MAMLNNQRVNDYLALLLSSHDYGMSMYRDNHGMIMDDNVPFFLWQNKPHREDMIHGIRTG